jgi:ABC-type nitrate/sulfonate/bicarbonate transport system ATPase subunit
MLELHKVALRFGPVRVLHGIDFRLAPGERVGILGASGAGKSSLLKMAAGLLPATHGACINSFRHSLLVFQEPRLLPWRRTQENIEIPLLASGLNKAEAHERALHWLSRVGLASSARAWPRELSGGMAQRATLARAFALQPDLLLLDEPFSALDRSLRTDLAQLCTECSHDTGAAMLCISHHPEELAGMVERCVLIEGGKLTPCSIDSSIERKPRHTAPRTRPHISSIQEPLAS